MSTRLARSSSNFDVQPRNLSLLHSLAGTWTTLALTRRFTPLTRTPF
jgi:hypothetical protein